MVVDGQEIVDNTEKDTACTEGLLSPKQLAQELGITPALVYTLWREGRIGGMKSEKNKVHFNKETLKKQLGFDGIQGLIRDRDAQIGRDRYSRRHDNKKDNKKDT